MHSTHSHSCVPACPGTCSHRTCCSCPRRGLACSKVTQGDVQQHPAACSRSSEQITAMNLSWLFEAQPPVSSPEMCTAPQEVAAFLARRASIRCLFLACGNVASRREHNHLKNSDTLKRNVPKASQQAMTVSSHVNRLGVRSAAGFANPLARGNGRTQSSRPLRPTHSLVHCVAVVAESRSRVCNCVIFYLKCHCFTLEAQSQTRHNSTVAPSWADSFLIHR